jgi:transcriptional regulator with XRE-family HTH domain
LTQVQLAERLRVAPNTVARWERDERAIPPVVEVALRAIVAEVPPDSPP